MISEELWIKFQLHYIIATSLLGIMVMLMYIAFWKPELDKFKKKIAARKRKKYLASKT